MSSTDGKQLVNLAYHAAIVSGLSIGYAQLSRRFMKGTNPKLDFSPYDMGMVTLDVGLAIATKDLLIKQGLLPADVLK